MRNLTTPRSNSKLKVFIEISFFAALANVPDWSLPGWGHEAYHVSHSLFVLLLMSLPATPVGIILLRKFYTSRSAPWIWGGLCAALLSHIFLDAIYGAGGGIAMFWPLSDARLHLPLPWFQHLRPQDGVTLHNLRVFAVEAVFYGGILILSILARRRILPYISKPENLECQP